MSSPSTKKFITLGGLSTIAGKYACDDLIGKFRGRSRNIEKVADVIAIYHYHAVRFRKSRAYHAPSLIRTSEKVLPKLFCGSSSGSVTLSHRNIRKVFLDHRDTAILLYAASGIKASPFNNLLEAISSGAMVNYEDLLVKLLERAKDIQEQLTKLLYVNDGLGITISFPDLKQRPFRIRPFEAWQEDIIRRAYGRDSKAKGGAFRKT